MILPLFSLLLLGTVHGYIIEDRDGNMISKSLNEPAVKTQMRGAQTPNYVEDIIVVTLKPESKNIHDVIAEIRRRDADTSDADFVAPMRKEFHKLGVFTLHKPTEKAKQFLRSHIDVLSVGPAQMYYPTAYSWGTDRIDQPNLPLDNSYTIPGPGGAGVNIYVIDEGLDTNHYEFSNTNEREVENIFDAYSATLSSNNDQGGHGTHCSGTASGITIGVAPKANLYGVKVLGPSGGSTEDIVAGMEKVVEHALAHSNQYHVASMSLGGYCFHPAICQNDAMVTTITQMANFGVLTVVAAGNDASDACYFTPAAANDAITVGSTTVTDGLSYFSNHGGCVDVLAPGSDILSACAINNDIADAIGAVCNDESSYMSISGTSMATPHVTGIVALSIEKAVQRFGAVDPAKMYRIIRRLSSKGLIPSLPAGTPNLLAQIPPHHIFAAALDEIAAEEGW